MTRSHRPDLFKCIHTSSFLEAARRLRVIIHVDSNYLFISSRQMGSVGRHLKFIRVLSNHYLIIIPGRKTESRRQWQVHGILVCWVLILLKDVSSLKMSFLNSVMCTIYNVPCIREGWFIDLVSKRSSYRSEFIIFQNMPLVLCFGEWVFIFDVSFVLVWLAHG